MPKFLRRRPDSRDWGSVDQRLPIAETSFFFPAKQRRDLTEGRDERAEGDDARFGEEFGHFGDAPDVLLAVGVGEAQVLVETEAHVVAVETERRYAPIHQVVLQRERQRRLARARQSCRFKL